MELHLTVAAAATVVFAIITALIWKRAQVKTVLWWIGMTLLPAGIYLANLGEATAGAVSTLYAWWTSLTFTQFEWTGLAIGALSVLLIAGSRLIPSEPRKERAAIRQSGPSTTESKPAGRLAPRPATKPAAPATSQTSDTEFDEISELLRKRGIN